jgi:hypothetical protein
LRAFADEGETQWTYPFTADEAAKLRGAANEIDRLRDRIQKLEEQATDGREWDSCIRGVANGE